MFISGTKSIIEVSYTTLSTTAILSSNTAKLNGGLFYSLVYSNGCDFTLKNNFITSSTSTSGSGGVYFCQGSGKSNIEFINSVVKNS